LAADELEQLKLANANIARLESEPLRNPALLAELQRGKERLEASIAADQTRKVSTYELADVGGLAAVYDTMYRTVAEYAHISPRALEEFVARDPDAGRRVRVGAACGPAGGVRRFDGGQSRRWSRASGRLEAGCGGRRRGAPELERGLGREVGGWEARSGSS